MSEVNQDRAIMRIGPLQIAILLLVVATAMIHLSRGVLLGVPSLRPFPLLFYLNTLGYLFLGAALYLPQFARFQRPLRWTLVVYAAITILLWFLITGARPNLLAYIDKPIELALIALLIIEDQQARLRRRFFSPSPQE
jgi:cytochrome c oxidase subunit IV